MSTETMPSPFVVAIDTREQLPYQFAGLLSDVKDGSRPLAIATQVTTLGQGDYSVLGQETEIAIERKSLADLYSTLGQGRERFERELERLAGLTWAAVMVEADWPTILFAPPEHSSLNPKTVFRSVIAWQQRHTNVHWWFTGSRMLAEVATYRILERWARDHPPVEQPVTDTVVTDAYCDGGVIGKNPSREGGTWAYVHLNAAGHRVKDDSGITTYRDWTGLSTISNNVTELLAAVEALESLPDGWGGTLHTDSYVTQCRLLNRDAGMVGVPDELVMRLRLVQTRLGRFAVVLLDGHPTKAQLAEGVGKRGNPVSAWNVWCDKECGRQASLTRKAAAEPLLDS